MRKLFSTAILILAVLLPALACSQRGSGGCCRPNQNAPTAPSEPTGGTGEESPPTKAAEVKYTCPMHPEVVQSSPGKCPKCGMDLVKKQ